MQQIITIGINPSLESGVRGYTCEIQLNRITKSMQSVSQIIPPLGHVLAEQ